MTEMINIKINGLYDIWLPPHRAAREEYHTEYGWEKVRLESIRQSINKDDIVYYIGSEESEMPCLCQMWGAKVFLCEPNPKVWSNALAIWKKNGLGNPMGYFVGFASDVTNINPENIDFEQGEKDGWPLCAYGTIISDHGFRELNHQAYTTPQIRIDDLKIEPPNIISIDVEGSEGRVLRGAENTLRKYKPKIYLSAHPEMMALQYGEYLNDLRTWVKSFGYKETLLAYDHEIHFKYEV